MKDNLVAYLKLVELLNITEFVIKCIIHKSLIL